MIKFGETEFHTARPADPDAALVATTGCNVAEHVAMLERGGTAFQVAQAVHPFLRDTPGHDAIATAIGDDLAAARAAAIALLTPPAPAPAKKAGE